MRTAQVCTCSCLCADFGKSCRAHCGENVHICTDFHFFSMGVLARNYEKIYFRENVVVTKYMSARLGQHCTAHHCSSGCYSSSCKILKFCDSDFFCEHRCPKRYESLFIALKLLSLRKICRWSTFLKTKNQIPLKKKNQFFGPQKKSLL